MRFYLIPCFLFVIGSCEKDPFNNLDCQNLQSGLTENNEGAVKVEIEKLTIDLFADVQPDDPIGHEANLQILTDRINSSCTLIDAAIVCYACIETYPPMSEIGLEYELDGEKIVKIVDIVTPDGDKLHFGGLHD